MNRWTLPMALLWASGLGCSSSSTGGGRCNELQSKLDSCRLVLHSSLVCDSTAGQVDQCLLSCIVSASCSDLTPTSKTDPYVLCKKSCYSWGADAFVCDDLKGIVAKEGVCDGVPQCLDGSDEKGCPGDGGARDGAVTDGAARDAARGG